MAVNSPFLLKIYANPQGFYVIHRKSDRLLAGRLHWITGAMQAGIGRQIERKDGAPRGNCHVVRRRDDING